jgi:hypothetical protein
MPSAFTLNDFDKLIVESKNPRILFLSEKDFDVLKDKIHPHNRSWDQDGIYVMWRTTRVRPAVRVMDLSGCKLFGE